MVWKKVVVLLLKCLMNFKLIIEVVIFGRYVNYLVIDDLVFI